ncbi:MULTISPECIES: PAS domain-containing protein [Methanoculleus]|uniref:Signal transduction histidine kinase, nitrogen specific, NtrB n=2 Tax=Methanoculleus TaxID=45989 RepID=A3CXW7_METMJ|nr:MULTISPECIES: PAS domain-containing protein [Methanoculleus]ABN58217.1 signal transduction histidine kinase, nitrogen specific, NtrB [Methanoculleus marisnigri JR1]MCC7554915.1 PAS domain-containing protein [Methanoculleus marisnigri]UYU19595.1 PAS domain-containing protein [Methanoculleus submarinus]
MDSNMMSRLEAGGIPKAVPDVTATMLQQVIETSLSGICIVDRQGCIAFANPSLLAMWEYDLSEVVGKPVTRLWLSPEGGRDCIDCALASGQWTGTIAARRRDASSFPSRISLSTVRDPGTAEVWLLLSCIEVDVRRGAQDAPGHRRSLEAAVAATPARFMDPAEIDPAIDDSLEDLGRACGASRVYLALFNDLRTLLGTTHEWCRAGQAPLRGESRNLFKGDPPRWTVQVLEGETVIVNGVSGNGRPEREERDFLERHGATAALMIPLRLNGSVVGFVGFDTDGEGPRFTDEDVALLSAAVHIIAGAIDRKQSEYIFRESEDLYQIVLDAITDTVTVVDTRLTLLLANDAFVAWCEDLGLETNVVGKDLFAVVPFFPPATRQLYERVIRTGRPLTSERSLQTGDRTMILREIRIPIFEHGEVARVVTVARDVTAQREVEDLKSKAYDQIERNMEQFALLADHIRNPLQAIMGRAELLDDTETTEKIRQQVQRINGIIDQLDERWGESRRLSMFWRKYS